MAAPGQRLAAVADGAGLEPRMTTVESRYEIMCPLCGLVDTQAVREEARAAAVLHHSACEGVLTVYDRMARRGSVEMWVLALTLEPLHRRRED